MRHPDFHMELKTGPTPALCDVCMQAAAETADDRFFQTYISNQMQSTLCDDCVKDGTRLLKQRRAESAVEA